MGARLLRLDLLGQAAPFHARGGAGGGATAAGGVPCGADKAAAGAGLQPGAAENVGLGLYGLVGLILRKGLLNDFDDSSLGDC